MSRAQNPTPRLVPVAAGRPGLLQAGVGSQAALGPAWTPQTAVSPAGSAGHVAGSARLLGRASLLPVALQACFTSSP